MILKIRKYGDEILSKKAARINFNTMRKELPKIINDMTQTCLAMNGVGLAAPQVGLDLSLAVIMLPLDKGEEKIYKKYVLINPEISLSKGVVSGSEGCLSFPGLDIRVERAQEVKVKYLNEKGLPVELKTSGLLAIILQHEIDHLNGRVFINRLKGEERAAAVAKIKELSKTW
ncbi:MAG: peptide deformylase [Elusimicrobiota bacterium]|jgi:peptide deformylase|nr:peptide deformylase [Elusimicrobiota bacterium]